jgi:phosphatidylserine decarboxylase
LESYDYLFIIKNIKYSLTEFLFGNQFKNFSYLADNLFQDKKKTFQITIYLSPGDCHRYYSPADLNITDRVYIPGFLEPVRPSYLKKHPKVFLTNERVTLRCLNKKNDLVFITYVGALNVGSVNLSFDDFLQTNKKLNSFEKSDPGFFVLRYTDIIKPKTKVFERKPLIFFRPSSPLLLQDIEKESQEFDMRDMINLDIDIVKDYKIKREDIKSSYLSFKENFLFHLIMYGKEDLKYNLYNSFLSYDIELHKKKMKLQNPKELKLEKYTISEEGLKMNRKEEMGWFNFGSTIVLIFTVDKEKEINFKFKEGDIVKIGQSLYDLNYNKELI